MGLKNFQKLEGCKSCRDDPRTSVFHVKLKPEEHEMLYFVAEKYGTDMQTIIRNCIREKYKRLIFRA